MTKIKQLACIWFVLLLVLMSPVVVLAANSSVNREANSVVNLVETSKSSGSSCSWNSSQGTYCMLAPLGEFVGGSEGRISIANGGLSQYLQGLFRMGIIVATGLAVIMITMGGLKYASTDAISGKSEGKEMIQQALLGLVLAFMSVLILRQINPQLLKSDLNLKKVDITSAENIGGGGVGAGGAGAAAGAAAAGAAGANQSTPPQTSSDNGLIVLPENDPFT